MDQVHWSCHWKTRCKYASLAWRWRIRCWTRKMDETNSKDRVIKIMAKLDKLYKKDDAISKFQAWETFETYKRPSKLPIPEYINEFENDLTR